MTDQQFDNYSFGIHTLVEYFGDMFHIVEVDFKRRTVGLENGCILKHTEIKNIRD